MTHPHDAAAVRRLWLTWSHLLIPRAPELFGKVRPLSVSTFSCRRTSQSEEPTNAKLAAVAQQPRRPFRHEALGRIAATPHPLAAFIFSRDQKTIDRFIGELSFGGGAVNQVNIHLFIETMPFGGVGGMGHYYGKHGFDMLSHAKSMLISPPDVAIDHLFPPYTREKNAALKQWFEY